MVRQPDSSPNFTINLNGKRQTFKSLPEEIVRDFREYAIPTIEIDLDDESSLDEIIKLFVDINQQGERVKRFDIVKAIGGENPLLLSVLDLVAQEQVRREDLYYKRRNNAFTRVLQNLQTVINAEDNNVKVDRMWERLVEIALFNRTGSHRQPGQVLKVFLKAGEEANTVELESAEISKLRKCFTFLDNCYKGSSLQICLRQTVLRRII